MSEDVVKPIIGILGGMGPLASAEFINTVYQYTVGMREQDAPIVVLLSDPTIPDRTEAFLTGDRQDFRNRFIQSLRLFEQFNVSKIIVCCITAHHIFPELPQDLRSKILSLLDVIFIELSIRQKRHLLLCTEGSRKLGLFQSHPQWNELREFIVLPDEQDQKMIHNFIYSIKRNHDICQLINMLNSILIKYNVGSFIGGCTEIHLVTKYLASHIPDCGFSCLDPLIILAQRLCRGNL